MSLSLSSSSSAAAAAAANGAGSNNANSTIYSGLRASVDDASSNESSLSRVEVNQRALIDKVCTTRNTAHSTRNTALLSKEAKRRTRTTLWCCTALHTIIIIIWRGVLLVY
jgi:hypothetical protein